MSLLSSQNPGTSKVVLYVFLPYCNEIQFEVKVTVKRFGEEATPEFLVGLKSLVDESSVNEGDSQTRRRRNQSSLNVGLRFGESMF